MSHPKIAFFDIETAPSLGYFWGRLWETNIIGVKAPWYMLSFAYKWMGEDKVHFHGISDYKTFKKNKEDDSELLEDLRDLMDEADILIAHNGDRFDIRKTRARFLMQAVDPPSPCKSIDTLKEARKIGNFDSNKLNDLAIAFGIGKKLPHTGFDLWKRAMDGDREAWKTMKAYNIRDVILLEKVYEKLKPYMANHPDLRIYDDAIGCPTCRSTKIERRGFAVARRRKYRRYHCKNCASWFQGAIIKPGDK